jgi:hypothetical protein
MMNRESHAKRFLAGLILTLAAGTATIWYFTGFFLALAYASGGATCLIFAKVAPSYHPEIEEDTEQNPGFH